MQHLDLYNHPEARVSHRKDGKQGCLTQLVHPYQRNRSKLHLQTFNNQFLPEFECFLFGDEQC